MKKDTSTNLVNLSIRPIADHLDELKYPCRILKWKMTWIDWSDTQGISLGLRQWCSLLDLNKAMMSTLISRLAVRRDLKHGPCFHST